MNETATDVVDLTAELVSRASENPPGNERRVAEFVAERLAASPVPFEIERQTVEPGRTNVIARGGDPTKGTVLLTGHLDVVPASADDWSGDPYDPRVADGRVVGRGAADMKGALAAKILAAESYLRTDDPGEVVLAFVVGEEASGVGSRALVESGIDADAAVVGEPTGLDVCVAQKGVVRYRVELRGESCHSGAPDEGVDAIAGLGRVLDAVNRLDDRLRADSTHPQLTPETVTATEVEGGIAPGVVADRAAVTLDWRFHPGDTAPDRFDGLLSAALESALEPTSVSVDLERTLFARGAAVPDDHELVGTAQPVSGFSRSDGSIFVSSMSIETSVPLPLSSSAFNRYAELRPSKTPVSTIVSGSVVRTSAYSTSRQFGHSESGRRSVRESDASSSDRNCPSPVTVS